MDNTYSKNSNSPTDPNSDLQLPPQFTWPPSPIQAFAQPDLEYEHNTHRTPQHQPVTTPAHAEGHPSPTAGPGVILSLRSLPAVNSESSKATTTFTRTRVTDGLDVQSKTPLHCNTGTGHHQIGRLFCSRKGYRWILLLYGPMIPKAGQYARSPYRVVS